MASSKFKSPQDKAAATRAGPSERGKALPENPLVYPKTSGPDNSGLQTPTEHAMRAPQDSAPASEDEPPPRPSLLSLHWMDDAEPSVLLVGADRSVLSELAAALTDQGIYVEVTPGKAVLDAIVAATPKLIVLVGDAARDGGKAMLRKLQATDLGASVPVAVLVDEPTVEDRLRAFRSGALAVMARSDGVQSVAERLAALVRQPEARKERSTIGEVELGDLLDAVGSRVVADLAPGEKLTPAECNALRIKLGDGSELVKAVDAFATRLRASVRVERVAGQRVSDARALKPDSVGASRLGDVSGLRVVLVDSDSARADAIAVALRVRGAAVLVTGFDPAEPLYEHLRKFDPAVIVVGSLDLRLAWRLATRLKGDVRLRWSPLLLVDWEDVRPFEATSSKEGLLEPIALLGELERRLSARAESGARFEARIEALGPARSLRALASSSRSVRILIEAPQIAFEVDLAQGMVMRAVARPANTSRELEGPDALGALVALRSGSLRVEPLARAAAVNVLRPVEDALDAASVAERAAPTSEPEPNTVRLPRDEVAEPSAQIAAPANEPIEKPAPKVAAAPANEPVAPAEAPFEALWTHASQWPAPLQKRIKLGGFWMPAWALAATALGAAIGIVALVVAASGGKQEESKPAPARTAERTEQQPPRPATLTERAATGDGEAIAAIEQRSARERTIEETIALSDGKIALERAKVDALAKKIHATPTLLEDLPTVRQLLAFAKDERISAHTLRAIASLPGPRSADVLYHVWVGGNARTAATRLAEALVSSKGVREKASPALAVALDLREDKTCEEYRAILPRAAQDADRRSLKPLARLMSRQGCGAARKADCYPCLRRTKDLERAIHAARGRRAPEL